MNSYNVLRTGICQKAIVWVVYTIRNGKPRKRAIALDLLQGIKSLELEPSSVLFRDRQIFIMSFLLSGMSFTDMCHLKLSNIIDGRIKFSQQKTNYPFDIKIDDQLKPILDFFIKGKQKEDYILPVIKRKDPISQYKDVLWARSRYNRNLKKIAKLAGIEENLASYVSRHSFASGADDLGVPVTAISQMLGHKKISTTEAYKDLKEIARMAKVPNPDQITFYVARHTFATVLKDSGHSVEIIKEL